MKKLWTIVTTVLMTMGILAGCFDENGNQSDWQESSSPSSQTESSDSIDTGNSSIVGDNGADTENPEGEPDSGSDVDSSLESDSSDIESAFPGGTIVPPITDGGNFDGTV